MLKNLAGVWRKKNLKTLREDNLSPGLDLKPWLPETKEEC